MLSKNKIYSKGGMLSKKPFNKGVKVKNKPAKSPKPKIENTHYVPKDFIYKFQAGRSLQAQIADASKQAKKVPWKEGAKWLKKPNRLDLPGLFYLGRYFW